MGCWMRSVALRLLLLLRLSAVVCPFSHLRTSLCKWCEASVPSCEGSVCLSNCSLTSFCSHSQEVCVAIWRQTNDSMTVQTLCHHPGLPLEGVDPGVLANGTSRDCHMVSQPAQDATMFVCGCQGEHECNDRLLFDKGANGFSRLQTKDVLPVVVLSLVPPVLLALTASLLFYLYRTRRHGKPAWHARPPLRPYRGLALPRGVCGGVDVPHPSQQGAKAPCDRKLQAAGDKSAGDGTQPLAIQLEVLVGKGRFAEVWRGRLLHGERGGASGHDSVAVKVFPAMEYASWQNERSILSDPKLEHENVVQFLAAEERGTPGHAHRKYWLVLAYHSLGNLQDFLSANVLSWEELLAMAASIAKGVAYLHSDTTSTGVPKVPVAHRDLKSSNMVLKSRRECVLCDFGLALRLDLSLTVDDYANSGQVGTARYMAPEVLESRVNLEDLEAFKQMDVYSMALVLWEMVSRCQAAGELKEYEPAFGSRVCEQPCVDSMRDLVLRDRGRPPIPPAWTMHQGLAVLCSTITECWDHDPEARLTAHCVVERFAVLEQEQQEHPGAPEGSKQEDMSPQSSELLPPPCPLALQSESQMPSDAPGSSSTPSPAP